MLKGTLYDDEENSVSLSVPLASALLGYHFNLKALSISLSVGGRYTHIESQPKISVPFKGLVPHAQLTVGLSF